MTHRFRMALCAGAAVAALHGPAARAADVTAAEASAAEAQVRAWLAEALGPRVKLPQQPVRLTPAGDHFDVVVPIRFRGLSAAEPVQVTATARPVGNGRWSVEGIRSTAPVTYMTQTTALPKKGEPGGPKTVTLAYTSDSEGQDGQMQLDPSFGTPTTWTSSKKAGKTTVKSDGLVVQDSRTGPTNSVMVVRPAGAGRVDVTSSTTAQDSQSEFQVPGLPPIQLAMRLVRSEGEIKGLSRDQATEMTRNGRRKPGRRVRGQIQEPRGGAAGGAGAGGRVGRRVAGLGVRHDR